MEKGNQTKPPKPDNCLTSGVSALYASPMGRALAIVVAITLLVLLAIVGVTLVGVVLLLFG